MMTQRKLSTRTPTKKQLEAIKPHQFKPGQSGNAGGRPKKGILTDVIEAMANELVPSDPQGRTWKRLVAEQLYAGAIKGKVQAASEIMDRVEGKAIQRVDIEGNLPEDDPKEKLRAFVAKLCATRDSPK